jgi:hypothetical protein
VITCDANESINWLHDRQPVILFDNTMINLWLDNTTDINTINILLSQYSGNHNKHIESSNKDIFNHLIVVHKVTNKINISTYQSDEWLYDLNNTNNITTNNNRSNVKDKNSVMKYFNNSSNNNTSICNENNVSPLCKKRTVLYDNESVIEHKVNEDNTDDIQINKTNERNIEHNTLFPEISQINTSTTINMNQNMNPQEMQNIKMKSHNNMSPFKQESPKKIVEVVSNATSSSPNSFAENSHKKQKTLLSYFNIN